MRTGYWVGLFLACAITVSAQTVPASFNYQGVLRDGSGQRLSGAAAESPTVQFRLWDSPASGTLLWGRTYAVLLDTNGLFNVEFQDGTGTEIVPNKTLAAVVAANPDLYLGLTVVGSTEIAPRQKLLSVPFALMAGDVQSASKDFTVAGSLTAKGGLAVTGVFTATNNASTLAGYGTIPIGGIIMWSGAESAIPDGWQLCNSAKGTPDLRNRFVVGAGTGGNYGVGAMGGVTNVTLTAAQIPAHGHTYKDGYYVEADRSSTYVDGGSKDSIGKSVTGSQGSDTDNTYIYWRPMTTDNNTGGGGGHENRPPFYALCYIMRIK